MHTNLLMHPLKILWILRTCLLTRVSIIIHRMDGAGLEQLIIGLLSFISVLLICGKGLPDFLPVSMC